MVKENYWKRIGISQICGFAVNALGIFAEKFLRPVCIHCKILVHYGALCLTNLLMSRVFGKELSNLLVISAKFSHKSLPYWVCQVTKPYGMKLNKKVHFTVHIIGGHNYECYSMMLISNPCHFTNALHMPGFLIRCTTYLRTVTSLGMQLPGLWAVSLLVLSLLLELPRFSRESCSITR